MTEFRLDYLPLSADLQKTEDMAALLKVLADPTRLRILIFLAEHRERKCVCELQSMFNLGQPTISHHVKQLRLFELIRSFRKGTWIEYQITERGFQVYENVLKLFHERMDEK